MQTIKIEQMISAGIPLNEIERWLDDNEQARAIARCESDEDEQAEVGTTT